MKMEYSDIFSVEWEEVNVRGQLEVLKGGPSERMSG